MANNPRSPRREGSPQITDDLLARLENPRPLLDSDNAPGHLLDPVAKARAKADAIGTRPEFKPQPKVHRDTADASERVEIRDLSLRARQAATGTANRARISNQTGAAITQKGMYDGHPPLHLLVEGTQAAVTSAVAEIHKLLEAAKVADEKMATPKIKEEEPDSYGSYDNNDPHGYT